MLFDERRCVNCIKSRLPCGPLTKPLGKRGPTIKTEAQFKKLLMFKANRLRRERGMSKEAILGLLDQEDDEESLQEESRRRSSEPIQELSAASNSGLDIQSQGQQSHESLEMINQSLYEPYPSLESGPHFDQQTPQMMYQFTRESNLSLNSSYHFSTNEQQRHESPELLSPVIREFYPSSDGANNNGQQPPEFPVEMFDFEFMTPDHPYLFPFEEQNLVASVPDSDYDALMAVFPFFLFVLM